MQMLSFPFLSPRCRRPAVHIRLSPPPYQSCCSRSPCVVSLSLFLACLFSSLSCPCPAHDNSHLLSVCLPSIAASSSRMSILVPMASKCIPYTGTVLTTPLRPTVPGRCRFCVDVTLLLMRINQLRVCFWSPSLRTISLRPNYEHALIWPKGFVALKATLFWL